MQLQLVTGVATYVYRLSQKNTSADKHIEKLLLGNKCDLESKRVVSYETAQKVSPVSHDLAGYYMWSTKLAEAQNIFSYIETSAKTHLNIDKVQYNVQSINNVATLLLLKCILYGYLGRQPTMIPV